MKIRQFIKNLFNISFNQIKDEKDSLFLKDDFNFHKSIKLYKAFNEYNDINQEIFDDLEIGKVLSPHKIFSEKNIKKMNDLRSAIKPQLNSLLSLNKIGIEFELYLFGGVPRDLVLEKDINDIDILMTVKPFDAYSFQKIVKCYDFLNQEQRQLIFNLFDGEKFKNSCKKGDLTDCEEEIKDFQVKMIAACLNPKDIISETYYKIEKTGLYNDGYHKLIISNSVHGKLKIQAKDYLIDLNISNNSIMAFSKNIDYGLSKIFMNIYNKKSFIESNEEMIYSLLCEKDFFEDIKNKKLVLNPEYLTDEQIIESVENRLKKMKDKFPDYELDILQNDQIKYIKAKQILDNQIIIESLGNDMMSDTVKPKPKKI